MKIKLSVLFVPALDVILLVAAFLALSGALMYENVVDVTLPKSVGSEVISRNNPTVTLTPGGGIFLNGRKISKEGLSILLQMTASLSEKKDKKEVLIIKSDGDVPFRTTVEIVRIARESGIDRVAIATSAGD